MTFWTKAAGKAESISPEAKGENGRERWRDGGGEGGGAGGAGGGGIHHLVRCSISFAWFILSKEGPRHANES